MRCEEHDCVHPCEGCKEALVNVLGVPEVLVRVRDLNFGFKGKVWKLENLSAYAKSTTIVQGRIDHEVGMWIDFEWVPLSLLLASKVVEPRG